MRIHYFADGTKGYHFEDDLEKAVHFFGTLFWNMGVSDARRRRYQAGDYEMTECETAIQLFAGARN